MVAAQTVPSPRDIGAVVGEEGGHDDYDIDSLGLKGKGRGKTGKGGKSTGKNSEGSGLNCGHCGKAGHSADQCWAKHGRPGGGSSSSGSSSSAGAGKSTRQAAGKGPRGNCWVCGRAGHLAKDCPQRARAVHELEGEGGEETG